MRSYFAAGCFAYFLMLAYSVVVPSTRRALSTQIKLFPQGLKTPANAVRGDVNLDGAFTVSDYNFLRRFIVGAHARVGVVQTRGDRSGARRATTAVPREAARALDE